MLSRFVLFHNRKLITKSGEESISFWFILDVGHVESVNVGESLAVNVGSAADANIPRSLNRRRLQSCFE